MHKVLGIGGFFFRSKDPAALSAWYRDHLGVDPVPQDYEAPAWRSSGGVTVFAPFPSDSDYFGDPATGWMLNFRVADLDAMVVQLKAAGVVVAPDEQVHPNGRFARLHDPEGNPVELWEPAGAAFESEEPSA